MPKGSTRKLTVAVASTTALVSRLTETLIAAPGSTDRRQSCRVGGGGVRTVGMVPTKKPLFGASSRTRTRSSSPLAVRIMISKLSRTNGSRLSDVERMPKATDCPAVKLLDWVREMVDVPGVKGGAPVSDDATGPVTPQPLPSMRVVSAPPGGSMR